ncbi:hypothetical protein [Meiothermus granaticius]|uniref:Uncharacterized protein n=1 Tax=Meiothermus granaticius NBRC 107808 TaxID=1227551 RepID=A0A399F8L3_9DEIN|nr:hypothetical protein [Meiothermus granaticius]RIH93007.1 hypothetical protein Mgrana_01131 [Meiothermus granaticius NBRC 107808]GEM86155.1 hypothetical protein MGR01S_07800 [Meiothermus granaticius NBRC 107808]
MQPRLDQVVVWAENGRVVVWVEYFDRLGKLQRETFHPPTGDFAQALEEVARALGRRGVVGPGRVRKRVGGQLARLSSLERGFLEALEQAGADEEA